MTKTASLVTVGALRQVLQKPEAKRYGLFFVLLILVQGALFWADSAVQFFMRDSASYILSAITRIPPTDRSFVYGYFIRWVALSTHSLTALVAAQILLACGASAVAFHILTRYFRARFWIALCAALLLSFEPLQILYARYALTETLALFIFTLYLWVILHYFETSKACWLVVVQALAVLLISIRFAFIPVAWIGAVIIPLIGFWGKAKRREDFVRCGVHLTLSLLMLFAFTTTYKQIHGRMQHKPPAYSYDDGFFAMGFVTPLLKPADFPDPELGSRLLSNPAFPMANHRNRAAHRWMDDGIVSRLQQVVPDRIEANEIAKTAAVRAVTRNPLEFMRLGFRTFLDHFKKDYFHESIVTCLGNFTLDERFHGVLVQFFGYTGDRSSALEQRSLTGRIFLKSARWLQFLLFVPVFWLALLVLVRGEDQRRVYLLFGAYSLLFVASALFLVERPTPRYLHIPAWLSLIAAGAGLELFAGRLKKRKNDAMDDLPRTTPPSAPTWISTFFTQNPRTQTLLLSWGLILIFLVLIWLKYLILFNPPGPMCFGDELIYKRHAAFFFNNVAVHSAHYPPLYPLLLAPAFLFQNWYEVIIRINAIFLLALLICVWVLARAYVSRRLAAFAALLMLLTPFAVIYSDFILSENLFMVLFVLSVWLALQGADGSRVGAVAFGIVLGMALMTRHLMLPAVFILSFFWIALPWLQTDRQNSPSWGEIRLNGWVMVLCFLLVYGSWLTYTFWLDIPMAKAMGFGISGFKAPQKSFDSAIMWVTVYGAYLVLAAAPFLLMFVLSAIGTSRRSLTRPLSRETAFVWLVVLLTVCYWLISANHSFSARYNQASPLYLIGRYLVFLTPLYIVLGVILLNRLLKTDRGFEGGHVLISTALTLGLVFGARWILYDDGIWNLPDWFANIEFNSPDGFPYKSRVIGFVSLTGVVLTGAILLYRRSLGRLNAVMAIGAVLLVWYGAVYAASVNRLPINQNGVHPRKIAPVLAKEVEKSAIPPDLYYDVPGLDVDTLKMALIFWEVEYDRRKLQPLFHQDEIQQPSSSFMILSRRKLAGAPLLAYDTREGMFYLYKINDRKTLPAARIVAHGPKIIRGGEGFNTQPNGSSAIWVKTEHATPWTVVVLNGMEMQTTVESDSLVTAGVPVDVFEKPVKIELRLNDRLTGAQSKPVFIEIIP